LPRDTSKWLYLDAEILKFLNGRLADEPEFTAAQALDLFRFYNDLRDPGFGFQVTLDSWRDIVWEENARPPEGVKAKIHEPSVRKVGAGHLVTGYVWDMGSTELRKVDLTYNGRSFTMEVIVEGRFGAPHILM
jgi:hypothetical protein